MPKNITYLRVSTPGQDLEKNKADDSNEKNLDEVEFVQEKVSSKITSRNHNMGRMASEMKFFLERNPIPEKFLKKGSSENLGI